MAEWKPGDSNLFADENSNRTIRVLFVEDNPDDVELALRECRRANLAVALDTVTSKEEFLEKLHQGSYDIVVADYRLGRWNGLDALHVLKQTGKDVPFILVTGVLGEETAVDCIKQGATDYVLKDRLARLPVAVRRAIRHAHLREERKKADERLQDSEQMFRTLAEAVDSAIFVYLGTRCRYANRQAELLTGYSREELLSMDSLRLIHPDSRDTVVQMGFSNGRDGVISRYFEVEIVTKSGARRWLDMTSSVIELTGRRGRILTAFDITERKIALEETQRLATIDPLTGLSNYRQFVNVFASELGRSHRTRRPFSLILLDLDKLKMINDQYGHLVGSRALCRVAGVLRSECRNMDMPARYGGDEFAVLLPETPGQAAESLAHRIAKAVSGDQEPPHLSVSFGLACCPEDGCAFEDVMQAADSRLYSMKRRPAAIAQLALVSSSLLRS